METAPVAIEDEEIGEPREVGPLDRAIMAQDALDQANQFNGIANQQKQLSATIGKTNPWLADRFMRAAKANRSLAVAIAEQARRIAA